MASQVDICNRALQILGASRITSITQDNKNARACNNAYEAVKLALLRRNVWSFSIKRASLAAESPAPDWGRANSFPLPSDYVRLAPPYTENNTNSLDWEIEGRKILTNDDDPLYIRYVYNVTDPNEMDALFRETFSAELAAEICEEITQSNAKKADAQARAKEKIEEAKRVGAIEKPPREMPDPTWLSVRA